MPEVTVSGNESPYSAGDSVALSCAVDFGGDLATFAWYKDAALLADETTSNLDFTYALAESGTYACLVTINGNEFTSSKATLIYERGMVMQKKSKLSFWCLC